MKRHHLIIALLLSIITIVALNALTPIAYRTLPNDYVRTKLILDTISRGLKTPSVVILGNSRGMSGINAIQLQDSIGIPVYNFCSPSQSLMESALFYGKLPDGINTIVQCIDEREFNNQSTTLTEAATRAFSLSGYTPDEYTRRMLNKEDYMGLSVSPLKRNLEARNSYKAGVSQLIVQLLDDDAPGDGIRRFDYPYMYPSDSSKTYIRDLNLLLQYVPDEGSEFPIDSTLKVHLTQVQGYLTSRGINIIYVLMPLCPDFNWDESTITNKVESVTQGVAPAHLVNCLTLLESDGFYDPVHPNKKGAKIISAQVGAKLKSYLN